MGDPCVNIKLPISLRCCVERKNQPLSIPTKALCIPQKRTTNWFRTATLSAPCRGQVNQRTILSMALNGWIKEELFIDFRLEECRTRDAVKDVLCRYVASYNRQRPCFAIGYDTPDNYCKRFYRGELEKKDTFSKRILTEEPKFAQKRKDTEK